MAAPRPYWKGYLKLSLVSCPIALYSAVSSGERVAFKQVNRTTGNKLRQQLVDEGTREPVESHGKGRGYEVGKNQYLIIEDHELDAIAIESSHTIDIDSFVPRAQIDERYLDSPYYLVPNDQVGQEAFAVIRDAMRGKDMVAIGRVVIAKRERIIMLRPWEKGLLGTSLRYAYEVRDTATYFEDISDFSAPKDMLTLAEHILESKRADFDPTQFTDRYEEAVVDMLKKKQAGLPAPKTSVEPPARNVVNLMDALRRSIAQEQGSQPEAATPPKRKTKPPKRIEGQREMLLPITGKKAEAEAPPKAQPSPAAPKSQPRAPKRKVS